MKRLVSARLRAVRLLGCAALMAGALVGVLVAASSGSTQPHGGPAPKPQAVPVYHASRDWESHSRRSIDALGRARDVATSRRARPGTEVPSLRTANSRTFVGPNGSYEARISQTPINYRDAQGRWMPIDNRLGSVAGSALENRANAYRVRIPRQLDRAPVVFSTGHARVATRLLGASPATASVAGNTARFSDVLTGVDEHLTASTDSLVDEMSLHGSDAQSVFRYRVSQPAGLHAQLDDGVVRFIDRQGRTRISFARPFVYDATHRSRGSRSVQVSLHHDRGGLIMTLSAQSAWLRQTLAAGDRVVVDPETDPGLYATQTCTIDASAPTTSECAASTQNIGWDGAHDHRTLLQFNVQASVPRDVQVLGTRVQANLASETTSTPISVGAYALTRAWSTAATWNSSNGSVPWTTAGGDTQAAPADTETVGGSVNAPVRWYPLALVQGWVDGTTPNYGVMLRGATNTTTNELSVNGAYLYVYYEPRGGAMPSSSFTSFKLDDRMSAGVNDANGNLVLKNNDVRIQGTGLSLVLDRYVNNLSGEAGLSIDGLYPNTDSPFIYYYAGDGAAYSFRRNSDGSFTSPPGLGKTLTQNSAGQYTLTDPHNGTSEIFQGQLGGSFVPTSRKDQNGNTISYTWDHINQASYLDAPQQLQSITDTRGRKVTLGYDANDNLISMTDSTGRVWKYAADSDGNTITYQDPSGAKTYYLYDSAGDLTQITSPGGRITKFAYANEANGDYRVTSVTQVTNSTTGAGDTTSFAYSATPSSPCQVSDYTDVVVTDPVGNKTTYCNDPMDRARVVYDPLGHQHNSTYDVDGNVIQVGTGTGTTITKATYDASDNLLSETDATNVSTSFAYGDSSHPDYATSSTDGQGSQLGYVYYGAGQTGAGAGGGNLKSISSNGGSSPIYNFAYNANGTLATETDQAGNVTTYSYDAKGNLTKVTPAIAVNPAGVAQLKATSYTPDALSRVASSTNGNGYKTSYTYDALDRVTQIKYADGSTITNTYDPDGNMTKQVDSAGNAAQQTGTEIWTFDQKNRVTQMTLPGGQSSSYTYDGDDDLKTLTDSTGTTTYGYNAANQLTSLAIPGGSCASTVSGCATFTYDANGNRTTTNLPNGVTQTQTSDSDGHVLTLQAKNAGGTVLTKYSYSYMNGSAPTDLVYSVTDKDGNKTTYTYDNRDRLVKAATTGTAAAADTYSYDANNNRISSTDSNGSYTWAYNADNEACWKATGTISSPSCASPPTGATTFGYDADSNQTSQSGAWSATYNNRGQMATEAAAGDTAGKLAYQGPGQDNLAADNGDQSGYTYENNLLGPGIQHGGQWGDEDYVREPDGQLFSTYSDGKRTYPLFDGQGSLASISDISGGSDGYFTYDPFGIILTSVNQSFNNEFGWDGGQYAGGSFMHFGARFLSRSQGRFTQEDPSSHAADPSNYNPYVFAGDDPTSESDPSGETAAEGPSQNPDLRPRRHLPPCDGGGGDDGDAPDEPPFPDLDTPTPGVPGMLEPTPGFAKDCLDPHDPNGYA